MGHTSFRERRAGFDAYFERCRQGLEAVPPIGLRSTCACCGYPTIEPLPSLDVCYLCQWVSEAPEGPLAVEGGYAEDERITLPEARRNFKRYKNMYGHPREQLRCARFEDGSFIRSAKSSVAAAFDSLLSAPTENVRAASWNYILTWERRLKDHMYESILAAEMGIESEPSD